jgi:Tat protein secretion system quality control protein TatD with DNase activity
MKLPQQQYPIYEVKLVSHKDPIKFRPFTVREEKLLLMAVTAQDIETIVNSLKQIIQNCVIGDFDVDNMAMVDLETIFCHLRARSIGEIGQQVYKCKQQVDGKDCGMLIQVPINYLAIPIINQDTEKQIKLTNEIGVQMKFPTYSLIQRLTKIKEGDDLELIIAAGCLDLIYDKESVHKASDCTEDELILFLSNLMSDKYEKIKAFVEKIPQSKLVVEKDCPKCAFHHTFTLEGLEDFFG